MKNNKSGLTCAYCGRVRPFVVSWYAQCDDCARINHVQTSQKVAVAIYLVVVLIGVLVSMYFI